MKTIVTLAGILMVLSAIGAAIYGGYLGVVFLWQVYAGLDEVLRIVLLSAAGVALLCALVIAGAIKSSALAANRGLLIEARLRLYKSLVESYRPAITPSELALQPASAEVLARLAEIDAEMQILASSQVLEAHAKLESALRDRQDRAQLIPLVQKLVKGIRRDLGHGSGYDESKIRFIFEPDPAEGADRQRQHAGA